ncbi:MAG TPA: protein DA1 [Iamia sp.]|jgi:hypothetical protein|nr:protein DA1 [Iamia sp.]
MTEAARRVAFDLGRVGVVVPRHIPVGALDASAIAADHRVVSGVRGQGRTITVTARRGAVEHRTISAIEVDPSLRGVDLGLVLAHELMHARLHLAGTPSLPAWLEEGLCEMVAVVWMSAVLPQAVLDRMLPALDGRRPALYRSGLARVQAAVRAHGVLPVIVAAERSGRLLPVP